MNYMAEDEQVILPADFMGPLPNPGGPGSYMSPAKLPNKGYVTVALPDGSTVLAKQNSSMPSWLLPVGIGIAALAFFRRR